MIVPLLIFAARDGVLGIGMRDGVFKIDFAVTGFGGVDAPRMGGRESIRLRL